MLPYTMHFWRVSRSKESFEKCAILHIDAQLSQWIGTHGFESQTFHLQSQISNGGLPSHHV